MARKQPQSVPDIRATMSNGLRVAASRFKANAGYLRRLKPTRRADLAACEKLAAHFAAQELTCRNLADQIDADKMMVVEA